MYFLIHRHSLGHCLLIWSSFPEVAYFNLAVRFPLHMHSVDAFVIVVLAPWHDIPLWLQLIHSQDHYSLLRCLQKVNSLADVYIVSQLMKAWNFSFFQQVKSLLLMGTLLANSWKPVISFSFIIIFLFLHLPPKGYLFLEMQNMMFHYIKIIRCWSHNNY